MEDGPLISEVVLSQLVSELDQGYTHSMHLKITTVRTLSPYKDLSSILRWQANIYIHITSTKLCRRRYIVDFESV
jgi:hypothetical protein